MAIDDITQDTKYNSNTGSSVCQEPPRLSAGRVLEHAQKCYAFLTYQRLMQTASLIACMALPLGVSGCTKDKYTNDAVAAIKKADIEEKEKARLIDFYKSPKQYYNSLAEKEKEGIDKFNTSPLEKDKEEIRKTYPWINPDKLSLSDKLLILDHLKGEAIKAFFISKATSGCNVDSHNLESTVAAINKADFDEEAKVRFIDIYKNPKKYYNALDENDKKKVDDFSSKSLTDSENKEIIKYLPWISQEKLSLADKLAIREYTVRSIIPPMR
jgi:hypothetical protein